MVDEREGHYEGHEEEEYHFSDEQAGYDMEAEAPKIVAPEKVNVPVMQHLSQRRTVVIGVIVFFVALAFIYKMLVPSTSSPVTEFSPATSSRSPMTAESKPAAPFALSTQVAAAQQQAEKIPVSASPTAVQHSSPPEILTTGSPVMNAPPAGVTPAVTVTAPPATSPMNVDQKAILDRLATLEQQNAAMMNLLQTEYAQKIADNETQVTMMRGKITEITKRINRMEAGITQVSRMLQGNGNHSTDALAPAAPEAPAVMYAPPAAKMSEPKPIYTVQAIIPGRAWLKSESGDTVTVAEGDVLKDYGRIVKIDPYDGVVNIDTGNKVITLSYGVGGG